MVKAATSELIRRTYTAFNQRDVDAALAGLCKDVEWPNVLEGTYLRGHDAVRAYWLEQFESTSPMVEPYGMTERADGRVAVDVHQVIRTLDGYVLVDRDVRHVLTLRDGRVARMEVEDS